jgi:hypothetical protein
MEFVKLKKKIFDFSPHKTKSAPNLILPSTQSNSVIPPQSSSIIIAKGDSAATSHYFASRDKNALTAVKKDTHGPTVILPDTSTLTATASGQLPFSSELSPKAKKTAIFANLQHSLISLGQLCDDDCEIILNKKKLYAMKKNKIILQGTRSTNGDGLWDIPIQTNQRNHPIIQPTNQPIMNIIIRKDQAKSDLIKYLHATCFSPTPNTLIAAIKKNHFTTWPGLTVKAVKNIYRHVLLLQKDISINKCKVSNLRRK